MRIKIRSILLLLIFFLSSCNIRPASVVPSVETSQIVWPTATYRVWATIAPDNVATSTPTPTARPLRVQPQGRIVFQSDQSGSLDIYVINADGSFLSRLTNDPAVDVFPTWSPDGERIAFTSDREGTPDIFIMNVDGTNLKRITDNTGNDVLPAWSPDGKQIAFVSDRDGNDEIYAMDADGSNLTRLTNDSEEDFFPNWSPDGEWIVFSSTRDVNSEIYKMNKIGGDITRLTDDPAADSYPVWSPDGTRIAFVSRRDGFANLYIMDTGGGNMLKLTEYKSIVEVPTWSSDSKMIAFASDMEGSRDIFIIGADGIGLARLTDAPGEEFYPAWSPGTSYLPEAIKEPTAAPDAVCVNTKDSTYGFTPENPVQIGYDPRLEGQDEHECLPWLLGPQGQSLQTELIEEVTVGDASICKVAVSYKGKAQADVMYFDINNYEQPKAPVGYSCGSPVEYLKAISSARYQK